MDFLKKNIFTIILIVAFLVGLSLLLYPTFSNYWNNFHQSKAVADYSSAVAHIDRIDYEKLWNDAVTYNEELSERNFNFDLNKEQIEEYNQLLDVTGTGIMAYIEIPKIRVSLPIYHGTDAAVLQIAVGHIPGSSLPVGGKSTHCVVSGHRGLPSAKLFTDIDHLVPGDEFYIKTLDEDLVYQVDQIKIVLPNELDELRIEEGEDYCTLVTCTPYGVNTHRLLVRGHRIEGSNAKQVRVTADAIQYDESIVASVIAAPILIVLLISVLVSSRKRKKR